MKRAEFHISELSAKYLGKKTMSSDMSGLMSPKKQPKKKAPADSEKSTTLL